MFLIGIGKFDPVLGWFALETNIVYCARSS